MNVDLGPAQKRAIRALAERWGCASEEELEAQHRTMLSLYRRGLVRPSPSTGKTHWVFDGKGWDVAEELAPARVEKVEEVDSLTVRLGEL